MSYQKELYQQVVLDHNRNPRNFKKLEKASHSCEGNNPLCGDKYTIDVYINEEGYVEEISFHGSGCAISKSSSSLMTTYVKGKKVEEVKEIFEEFHQMIIGNLDIDTQKHHLGKLTVFKGVQEFPSRTKCATLPWHTMMCALNKEKEITTE